MKFPISPWIVIMGICIFLMIVSLALSPGLFWFMFWLFVIVVCVWAIKKIFFEDTKK